MSRTRTLLSAGGHEIRRTPVLLALLVFLPAYLVGVFSFVAPDSRVAFSLADGEAVRTTLTAAFPAFTTPMAAALLAGIAGLFLMNAAADADERLAIAGYRPSEIVLSRLGLLAGVSAVATVVAVSVMGLSFTPNHPWWFSLAVFLAAAIYGVVGLLAGALLDRLPGVYLVLFGSMVDLFLFQNPLATDRPATARFTPGHYPLRLAMDAGFGDEVAVEPLGWSLVVLALLTLLAVGVVYRSLRS